MSKKKTALAFVAAVTRQDADQVRALANADYIQHNPYLPTGLEPFIGLFPVLEQHGTQADAVRVLEDGNFVVLHHLWKGAQPFGAAEMVSFDILRFDERGKIAEHWDALMPNTPPNPSGRTLLDGATEITDQDQTEANKAVVTELFRTIVHGSQEELGAMITGTFQPDYHQHNPTVADGIPAVFEAFAREGWKYDVHHKVLGEGNFVLSISEGSVHGVPSVFYDLVRFEAGKIVEHWDVIQEIPTEGLANDNGMFGF
ncbi:MAG: nuclear transport factor 2 family protein [Bacteroidota bacterium]